MSTLADRPCLPCSLSGLHSPPLVPSWCSSLQLQGPKPRALMSNLAEGGCWWGTKGTVAPFQLQIS